MFFSRISFKIAAWYAVAFLASALALFALTTFLLMDSLRKKDHDLLLEKSNEYAMLYARDGVNGLRLRVSSREIHNARDFVVRLSDSDGKTFFIHVPNRDDDENALRISEIDHFLAKEPRKNAWTVIPARDFGDDIEVIAKVLPTGELLHVGKDVEDREAFIQSYTQAYFQGLIPIFLLAIFVGGLLSNRLLNPIRGLTQTVQSIRSGNPKARVPLRESRDELWRLGDLFNQMLEQNERLVQGMMETVDNVAHDLRTPIMRLQNAVEGALRGKSEVADLKEALGDCKENSDLILKLVNVIMDISEAEAGTLRFKKENVTSVDLIDGAMDLYGFVAEEKNIVLKAGKIESFQLLADRARLIQVLSNLVDNAIKYSPQGSVITLESEINNGFGVIAVTDQGIGIPADEMPRIWNRLYRVDSSRSSRGLGLGLSLVKAIVAAHGGVVGAVPNPEGPGTKFFVKFKMT